MDENILTGKISRSTVSYKLILSDMLQLNNLWQELIAIPRYYITYHNSYSAKQTCNGFYHPTQLAIPTLNR